MESAKTDDGYSEPEYAKAQNRAKVPFYTPDIEKRIAPEVGDARHFAESLPHSIDLN
jgi:hypothetical protein